jgi:uridine phosphorylase
MHPDAHVGDLINANGAVRDEGTTRQYAPLAHPAVASPDVVQALRDAASTRGFTHHVGVVHTTDSYYGQHEPERMPIATELTDKHATLRSLGVLCSEMETATVFVVGGAVLACRVGSVLAVAGNRTGGEHLDSPAMIDRRNQAIEDAIIAAVDAVRLLALRDGD